MTMTLRTPGFLVLTLSSLLLFGCGGGGGGGGGGGSSSGGDSGGSNNGGSTGGGTSNATITQNDYMPLVSGLGWTYVAGGSQVNSLASVTTEISGAASPVFKINASEAGGPVGLIEHFYSSTTSEVGFWGIKGEIEIPVEGFGDITIESILFDAAIPYWRDSLLTSSSNEISVPTFTATIKARAAGFPFSSDVEINDSVVSHLGSASVDTGFGQLAVQRVAVGFTGEVSISGALGSFSTVVTYQDTVSFAKGIGIVKRETVITAEGAQGFELEQSLAGMSGLPEPIRFQEVQGQAVMVGNEDTVRVGSTSLTSSSNKLVNTPDPGWVQVAAAAGNVFTVSATGSALPSAPAGEVFYFETASGQILPLGISLLAE